MVILALILSLAFALRYPGLSWGLEESPPHFFHGDEPERAGWAEKLYIEHDLGEQIWYTKGFYVHIGLVGSIASLFTELSLLDLVLIGRYISLFYSLATIALVFFFGMFLKGRLLAISSAGLLAVFDLHATFAHFATIQSTGIFWAVLSLILIYFASFKRDKLFDLLAIASSAFTFTISFNFIPAFFAFLLILLRKENKKEKLYSIIMFFLAFTAIFYLGNGTLVTYKDVSFTYNVMSGYLMGFNEFGGMIPDKTPVQNMAENPLLYMFALIAGTSLPSLAIALLGFWFFFRHEPSKGPARKRNFLFCIILPNLLYFLTVNVSDSLYPRRIMFLLPWMALFGGFFITKLAEKIRSLGGAKKIAAIGLILVLFLYPLGITLVSQQNFVNETRKDAYEWIDTNIPKGSAIKIGKYTDIEDSILSGGSVPYNRTVHLQGYEFYELNDSVEADYIVLHENDYTAYYRKITTGFKKYPKCCSEVPVNYCILEQCLFGQKLLKGELPYKEIKKFEVANIFPERLFYKYFFGEYQQLVGDVVIFKNMA